MRYLFTQVIFDWFFNRSRVRRSSDVVFSLSPLLNESYIQFGNGLTVQNFPNISHPKENSLEITFGLVENLPGSGPNDTIEIFLKFRTAYEPLVLSGRSLELTALLQFDSGSDVVAKGFLVVGPLLKPLLEINKTVEVRFLIFIAALVTLLWCKPNERQQWCIH